MRPRAAISAGLGVALALAGGCAPRSTIGFDSPDPQARTIALARSVDDADDSKIPRYIVLLGSADPAQRMLAINALERRTGETMGYVHYAPEPSRLEAQRRWRRWWLERSGEGGAEALESAREAMADAGAAP